MNSLKTFFLMSGLAVFMVVIGTLLGGPRGAQLFFLIAMGMNFFAYYFSDKIVLRAYKARIVDEREAPQLVSTVRRLATQAGLPMPKVAIIPMDVPNAFATGRNPRNAVVAATTCLLDMMNQDELEGVLAHELGHVKNRDILLSTIAAAMVGAITMLSSMTRWSFLFGRGSNRSQGGIHPAVVLLLAILAPIGAMLIQMSISRSREFAADRAGAEISGKPLALASALAKLENMSQQQPREVNPSTAHMFIINPLGGMSSMSKLFRTHPTTDERIQRLQDHASGHTSS